MFRYKKISGTHLGAGSFLAVVLVLIVILAVVLILVVVLVLLVVLIAILVIHNRSSGYLYLRHCRFYSVSLISAFILCFEDKTYKESGCNGCGNSAGTGFQSACEDADKTILLNSFLHTFGKVVTEAC